MSVTERLAARLPKLSERIDRAPTVAVVKLHGLITPTPTPLSRIAINLSTVESALTRAFGHERLMAVALTINSPGGSATQSALVAERVRALAAKKKVPVLAFCEDVVASGGYWLACAADEIYAHATSLVGSIGVVSAGFGLAGLLDRFGVERRVHTAGAHKVRLDPFSAEKPEDVQWLEGLQAELHQLFVDWVRERRARKLRGSDNELFSGEVWTGRKAADLGLVDGLGTLREIVTKRFGEVEISVAEPKRPLLARLGLTGGMTSRLATGAGASESMLAAMEALEYRARWSSFGL
jgi:signal peptide peptidase SppA